MEQKKMNAPNYELIIGANIEELKRSLNDASRSTREMAAAVNQSMNTLGGTFAKVQKLFTGFTAVLAGTTAFGKIIQESVAWQTETLKMSKAMGITAEQASVMKTAIGHIGVDQELVTAGAMRMSKQIQTNSQAFTTLGITVKDAAGQYRPVTEIMGEVNTKLASIKNPIEQNIAGMQIYGRAWQNLKPLMRLTSDEMDWAKTRAQELGLEISNNSAEGARKFQLVLNDLSLIAKGLAVSAGQALLPVLSKLGEWLGEIGPAVCKIFSAAMSVIGNSIMTIVKYAEAAIGTLSQLGKVMAAVWNQNNAKAAEEWQQMMQGGDTNKEVYNMWAGADKQQGTSADKNSMPQQSYDFSKEKKGGNTKLKEWEAELQEQKAMFIQQNQGYEMSLQMEKDYWDGILATLKVGTKEYASVRKKSSDLELQIMKQGARDQRGLQQQEINAWVSQEMGMVAMQEQAAKQRYAMGAINQQELLTLEQQFENDRYEIQKSALEDRVELMMQDPNRNPVEVQKLNDQLLEIERQHQIKLNEIKGAQDKEAAAPYLSFMGDAQNSFAQGLTQMLTQAQSFRAAMQGIFTTIGNTFIQKVVSEPIAKWLAEMITGSAAFQALMTTVTATSTAAAATQATEQQALGVAGVMSNSSIAATAAMASVAAIPFVGWAMAPAVGAETFAMGMGFLATAAGGYDIPAGVDPLTQLHEREMVLPAQYADVIRGMSAQPAATGGSGITNINISVTDAKSFEDYLKKNSSALAPGLRRLARNNTAT